MVFEILENDNSTEMYAVLPIVQYISLIKKIDNYIFQNINIFCIQFQQLFTKIGFLKLI